MRQVVQSVRSGDLRVVDVPLPLIGATEVLVRVSHSIVSAGTERAVRELASASLLGKAKARPDLVRQVVKKAKNDGVLSTVRAVCNKLDDDMPLGYSACGQVVEVGEAVAGVTPGQWVATGGQGHADYQAVAGHLAVPLPDGVQPADAAFATVGSIALHALRQTETGPGGRVCVVGLGLLGQLTARLAHASGLEVCGIDLQEWNVERAKEHGVAAFVEEGEDTTDRILDWTRGRGVDAVLLTAATKSSGPIGRTPAILRDRGIAVVVGDIGLDLARTPFYEKELTIRFARSYGPGRYDRSYEGWGVDYPIGHVRFTEGRNLESFLDLLASGRLRVDDLVTHTFPIEQALEAYKAIAGADGPFLGVQLTFPEHAPPAPKPAPKARRTKQGQVRIGLLGAGNFVRATLLPAIQSAGVGPVTAVASRSGVSAHSLAERHHIPTVHASPSELIHDPAIDLVVIATPHDTHAALTCEALQAGKHVFCEKPLALTMEDLDRVEEVWRHSDGHLQVGFNRRHAPMIASVRELLGSGGPVSIVYRVNAGQIPSSHWTQDRLQGGRLLGEVCHFVDTCAVLADDEIQAVHAFGAGRDELALEDDLLISLRFKGGTIAAIAYSTTGSGRSSKERIEILGRGHSIVLDDYKTLTVDGQSQNGVSDKGHRGQFSQLGLALRDRGCVSTLMEISSMRHTLQALQSMRLLPADQ